MPSRVAIAAGGVLLLALGGCRSDAEITCRSRRSGDPAERWKEHLSLEAEDGFSGSVIVASGPQLLLNAEYGAARRDPAPTPFWIASISKAITATAAMTLVEEGRLDLHAPLSRYLPDVPPDWRNVTAHQMLAHRAGFRTPMRRTVRQAATTR